MIGILRFDVQGWRVSRPIQTHSDKQKKGRGWVQKLDIFLRCHKCIVPYAEKKGITLLSYDHNEPCCGKVQCDQEGAVAKSIIRSFINSNSD